MKLIQFSPDHIKLFQNYGGQEVRVGEVNDEDAKLFCKGDCFTAVRDDLSVIGCGGVMPATQFRATAWGLFQKTTPAEFVFIHKQTKSFLEGCRYRRIEAYVDPGFYPAVRWIKLLGFKMERAYIPLFFPDGTGASAWAFHK